MKSEKMKETKNTFFPAELHNISEHSLILTDVGWHPYEYEEWCYLPNFTVWEIPGPKEQCRLGLLVSQAAATSAVGEAACEPALIHSV